MPDIRDKLFDLVPSHCLNIRLKFYWGSYAPNGFKHITYIHTHIHTDIQKIHIHTDIKLVSVHCSIRFTIKFIRVI